VAGADSSGDGNLDLAVADLQSSTVSILLGNGDGTFRPQGVYGAGWEPFALQWATSMAMESLRWGGGIDTPERRVMKKFRTFGKLAQSCSDVVPLRFELVRKPDFLKIESEP